MTIAQASTVSFLMLCGHCESPLTSFTSEMAIHFAGLAGLDKPIVWLFPEVRICLQCGTAEFVVPARERKVLADRKPVDGAMISE